ncbi:hypothetical protein BXZ70DRAFT_908242 [Cristinia sonorae]|uniref:Uncharacterized protein n=1 Tax=Cristinia sonorae TaxID=1940300 RepID=A0A8K0UMZ4_9AGAR|nr:hypothetical protein BXZ70DRAFT_908242 [Cristinia sonorae]
MTSALHNGIMWISIQQLQGTLHLLLTGAGLLNEDDFYAHLLVRHPTVEDGIICVQYGKHTLDLEAESSIKKSVVAYLSDPSELSEKNVGTDGLEFDDMENKEAGAIEAAEDEANGVLEDDEGGQAMLKIVKEELSRIPHLQAALVDHPLPTADFPSTPLVKAAIILPTPPAPKRNSSLVASDYVLQPSFTVIGPALTDSDDDLKSDNLEADSLERETAFWQQSDSATSKDHRISDSGYLPMGKVDNWDHDDDIGSEDSFGKVVEREYIRGEGEGLTEVGEGGEDEDQDQGQDQDQDGAGPEVVSTSKLEKIGIIFNRHFKLLICAPCGEGHSFVTLFNHLKQERGTRRVLVDGKWKDMTVQFQHPPHGRFPSSVAGLSKMIVDSLREEGHIKDFTDIKDDDNDQWYRTSHPIYPDWPSERSPPKPIGGLRLFADGYSCKVPECQYHSVSRIGIRNHLLRDHEISSVLNRIQSGVTLQTLSEQPSKKRLFKVEPSSQDLASHISITKVDPLSTVDPLSEVDIDSLDPNSDQLLDLIFQTDPKDPCFQSLLRKADPSNPRYIEFVSQTLATQKSEVMEDLVEGVKANEKAILEFLKDSRIDKMIRATKSAIQRKLLPPEPHHDDFHRYKDLQRLVVRSFLEQLSYLTRDNEPIHPSVLLMITNAGRGTDRLRRPFQALTLHSSVSSYARAELRLVWSLIKAYELGAKESPYTLNKAQQTALKALYQGLEKNPDSVACLQHLDTLLRSVYFPDDTSTHILDVFYSPVVLFAALQFWDPKPRGAAYRSWFLIPPMLVKIQHNMRLRSLGILQGFDKASSADYEGNLGEISMQPFATIRQWIHEMSVEVKDLPRPSIARWEGEVLAINGKQIHFPSWVAHVHQMIAFTTNFIEVEILLGLLDFDAMEERFHISSLEQVTELGKGICFDATNSTFDNPESQAFMTLLVHAGALGVTVQSTAQGRTKFIFEKQKALEWLHKIHRAWTLVYALGFILQGPGGRLTEEQLYCPINTDALISNIFFNKQLKTGGFYSRYHKGQRKTGRSKHIIRTLPYCVFRLLYALLRVVRPIELSAIFDHLIPSEHHQIVRDSYRGSVFASLGVSWDPRFMSTVISQFVSEGGFEGMGVREFRHFTIAIQRQKLQVVYNKDQGAQALIQTADLMAAHTSEVADAHYARLETTVGLASIEGRFLQISQDWHRFVYGIGTSDIENAEQKEERRRNWRAEDSIMVATKKPAKPRIPGARQTATGQEVEDTQRTATRRTTRAKTVTR